MKAHLRRRVNRAVVAADVAVALSVTTRRDVIALDICGAVRSGVSHRALRHRYVVGRGGDAGHARNGVFEVRRRGGLGSRRVRLRGAVMKSSSSYSPTPLSLASLTAPLTTSRLGTW